MRIAGPVLGRSHAAAGSLMVAVLLATPTPAMERAHGVPGAGCGICHTTTSTQGATQAPRWNSLGASEVYRPFASAAKTAAERPGGSSLACLACHDGTIGAGHAPGSRASFSQLAGSHPVGVAYRSPASLRDGHLRDPETHPSGLGGTIASDLLVDGRVECTSCHDPHRGDGTSLRRDNTGSALCLTCHDR